MGRAAVNIWTAGGPVSANDLGITLVHENVKVVVPGADLDPTATLDRADAIERAVDALSELLDHGVRTVVDPTPIDQGRDVELMAEVARRGGSNLVRPPRFYSPSPSPL